ncbi:MULTISPECIES: BTAD domain-containing putative transcriptional regulator [Aeromicrobium]|uniref:BTAD domain-containing putative transcriptional regulator n=1 Tax=Aeromicrobium TaxID=2040 RepID=UPI00257D9C43|nr:MULTISPECIES: BTAD domain-containing putative transcriptional regulator [Aeromicrobium]
MTEPTTTPDASRFESLAPAPVEESSSAAARAGSALALVALLVGLPVALLLLGGAPPIPTELPSLRDLARQLSPEDLVSVLVGIVWLIWLVFVICVVLEVIATRRGGLARTVPFAGPLQHLARALIGGLLVTGLVAGPAANASGPSESDIAPQTGAVATAVVEAVTPAPEEKPTVADKIENRLEGELVYTVKAPKDGYHDNLWDIAERHLGDGFRYKEIYELNKDKVQLDGRKLELARLIQPGWQLAMPGDAVGVDRMPVEQAPVTPAPAGSQGGGGSSSASGAGGVESDSTAQAPESTAWWMGAGLLASGLLAALAVARRRRPGGEPDEAARETEADLRLAADHERAASLETALRHLTHACAHAGVDVPSAYAAVVGHDEVVLHLAPAVPEAVEGWEALEDGAVWRLAEDLATLEAPEDVEPAYPSLVSLGVDTEGRDVLVDLASSGGLITVGGDLHVSAEVITSLVLQAAVSPWSRSVRVLATGLPAAVASVAERVTLVPDVETAASELEASRADDVLTGRRREDALTLLAVGTSSPGFALERLAGVAGANPGTAAIAVGDHDAARWRLHVDEHGTLHVPQLGLAVTANRIGSHHAESVAALFASAGLTTRPGDDSDRVAISLPRRDADDAAWLTATSRVGILGSVIVDGPGEQAERRATVLTEIIAFLALHPEGVHPTVLAGAVWPLGVTPEVRDANIERARVWLGSDREGHHRVRESLDGRLSLGPDVVCDWDAFRHLVIASRRAEFPRDEIDLLRRALKLVRGPAFEDAPRGRYAWSATLGLSRTVGELVIDAALRLATLLQDGRDPAGSSAAAGAILRIYPTHEEAWRIILRARHETGGTAGVAAAVEQLLVALDGEPMDHTTATLVDELLPQGGSQVS